MAYYGQRGNYAAGDNYGRMGNYPYAAGGIFGSIGKFLGGVAKTAIGLAPGPIGAVARAVTSTPRSQVSIGPSAGPLALPTISMGPAAMPGQPIVDLARFGGTRRRMNVTNVKALRRAGRRVKGFLKLARRMGALPVGGSGKKLFKSKKRCR